MLEFTEDGIIIRDKEIRDGLLSKYASLFSAHYSSARAVQQDIAQKLEDLDALHKILDRYRPYKEAWDLVKSDIDEKPSNTDVRFESVGDWIAHREERHRYP